MKMRVPVPVRNDDRHLLPCRASLGSMSSVRSDFIWNGFYRIVVSYAICKCFSPSVSDTIFTKCLPRYYWQFNTELLYQVVEKFLISQIKKSLITLSMHANGKNVCIDFNKDWLNTTRIAVQHSSLMLLFFKYKCLLRTTNNVQHDHSWSPANINLCKICKSIFQMQVVQSTVKIYRLKMFSNRLWIFNLCNWLEIDSFYSHPLYIESLPGIWEVIIKSSLLLLICFSLVPVLLMLMDYLINENLINLLSNLIYVTFTITSNYDHSIKKKL